MKLPNPTISTNKTTTKSYNHLFCSTMVSSCLALMACTMLAPHTQNHAANYIDPRATATHQTTKDSDPGYNWFY
jgi:hypothetical protein